MACGCCAGTGGKAGWLGLTDDVWGLLLQVCGVVRWVAEVFIEFGH